MDSVGASFAKAVKSEADPYADTKVAEDDVAIDVCCAVCIVCFHTFLALSLSLCNMFWFFKSVKTSKEQRRRPYQSTKNREGQGKRTKRFAALLWQLWSVSEDCFP